MNRKQMLTWFAAEEEGQGMVEYALILAFIALVAIGALEIVGTSVTNSYKDVSEKISSVS